MISSSLLLLFLDSRSGIRDRGSEIRDPKPGIWDGKNEGLGSGINIPDPQHCFQGSFGSLTVLGSTQHLQNTTNVGFIYLKSSLFRFSNSVSEHLTFYFKIPEPASKPIC